MIEGSISEGILLLYSAYEDKIMNRVAHSFVPALQEDWWLGKELGNWTSRIRFARAFVKLNAMVAYIYLL